MTHQHSLKETEALHNSQESSQEEGASSAFPPKPQAGMEYAALFMHDYSTEPRLRDLPIRLMNIPRLILLAFIRLYQVTLSRGLPANTCRFYPSCSHYGYQAIYKHGALKGSVMAAWRVLRCNPFNRGGYDPVL
jgi:putative membrane protein insertion efficiency factor